MLAAIDFFCGAGGLTFGLERAGVDVRAAVDLDPACVHPIEKNTSAKFRLADVDDVTASDVRAWLSGAEFTLLAGCAPCQPFSTYTQARRASRDGRWRLLDRFGAIVGAVRPDLLTIENVPNLTRELVFTRFVRLLRDLGYHVTWSVVECADYGVPQRRRRLVLLGSRYGVVELVRPTHRGARRRTVRDAIERLAPLAAGESSPDPLHFAANLSPLNLKRIRASRPGGSWAEWPARLVARCHRQGNGRKYPSVYGRMEWDSPSPTITTQAYNYGSGRFGHPEQDRALSLREAALLQTFPRRFSFARDGEANMAVTGRLVGNAVPPRLGEIVGRSLLRHLDAITRS